MIDVYANAGIFGDKHQLAQDLARAVMRWEAVPEIPLFADNTAAFIHDLPAEAISTAAGRSDYVRVQVLTPAGVLDRDKQLGVVKELTEIVARAAGDSTLAQRTWVLLTESPEGGWGIAGHANTQADIAAAARAALSAGDSRMVLPDRSALLDGRRTRPGARRRDGDAAARARGVAGAGRPGVRAGRARGAGARVPPHRHRAGVRKRGERRPGAARERLARDEVFITTKFYPGRRDPLREAAYSIERLGVDYVDLYLVHWPAGGATWAWPGMEAARARSYARAIGVSNFDPDELDQVLAGATVAPVVDQVQFNPSAYRKALLDACDERASRSRPTARWAPAAQLRDPVVGGIAQRLGRSPPRSCCAGACSAASRSSPSRPIANASRRTPRSSTSSCSDDAMGELDALDRTGGTRAALERKWW